MQQSLGFNENKEKKNAHRYKIKDFLKYVNTKIVTLTMISLKCMCEQFVRRFFFWMTLQEMQNRNTSSSYPR